MSSFSTLRMYFQRTPKLAAPRGFIVPGSLLERMPMRAREANVIAPPLFHGTGLIIALLSISLGANTVLRRRFDAEAFLADVGQQAGARVPGEDLRQGGS